MTGARGKRRDIRPRERKLYGHIELVFHFFLENEVWILECVGERTLGNRLGYRSGAKDTNQQVRNDQPHKDREQKVPYKI